MGGRQDKPSYRHPFYELLDGLVMRSQLTRLSLGKKLGYSNSYVGKLLSGASPIDSSLLYQLISVIRPEITALGISESSLEHDIAELYTQFHLMILADQDEPFEAAASARGDERELALFQRMRAKALERFGVFVPFTIVRRLRQRATTRLAALKPIMLFAGITGSLVVAVGVIVGVALAAIAIVNVVGGDNHQALSDDTGDAVSSAPWRWPVTGTIIGKVPFNVTAQLVGSSTGDGRAGDGSGHGA